MSRKAGMPSRRGTVRETAYGKYQARWYVNEWDAETGQTRSARKTKNFPSEQEAYDFLDSISTDIRRGEYVDPSKASTPIGEVADEWVATLTKRANTRVNYISRLERNVLPFFGNGATPASAITTHDIRKLIAAMSARGLGRGTIRNAVSVLRMVLDTAVEIGARRDNPARSLKGSDYPEADYREMYYLTADEVAHLASCTRKPYNYLIYFAAYTGLRAGEIAALRMRDVDLLRNKVSVTQTVSEVKGAVIFEKRPKNKKPRIVHMPKGLVDLLMEYLGTQPQKTRDDFLFTGVPNRNNNEKDKTRERYVLRHNGWFRSAVWEPAKEVAGINQTHPGLRFHDLRHTTAALLIALGAHPKEICEHMGHSSIQITMDRYGHLYPDAKAALMERLDATFNAAQHNKQTRNVRTIGK